MTAFPWSQWLGCHVTERGPMSSPLFKREDGIAHWANGPVALVIIIIIRVVVVVQLGLYIEDIWMKLGRYMGHGPNSSYRDG